MIFPLVWAAPARADVIFRFEHTFKGKAPLRTTNIPFSVRAGNGRGPVIFDGRLFEAWNIHKTFTVSRRNDPDFDRFAAFLLNGRRDKLQFQFSTDKKKFSEPEVCWGDKHAQRIDLKGIKINNLHMRIESFRYVPPVQRWEGFWTAKVSFWASAPSVPTPKAIWAGLGMIGLIAVRKWLAARNVTAL
ncbi:MAG TPA: hypothetical protein VGQ99_10250 [Tepidisphaeraceae bacterium]|jgi:hypothetical protein|nr:hypothetical protein [Tepidisphaeraceae bacterium]